MRLFVLEKLTKILTNLFGTLWKLSTIRLIEDFFQISKLETFLFHGISLSKFQRCFRVRVRDKSLSFAENRSLRSHSCDQISSLSRPLHGHLIDLIPCQPPTEKLEAAEDEKMRLSYGDCCHVPSRPGMASVLSNSVDSRFHRFGVGLGVHDGRSMK